jgi:hypothetical protein
MPLDCAIPLDCAMPPSSAAATIITVTTANAAGLATVPDRSFARTLTAFPVTLVSSGQSVHPLIEGPQSRKSRSK